VGTYKVNTVLDKIILLGLGFQPKKVLINGKKKVDCDYDSLKQVIICDNLNIDLLQVTKVKFSK